MTANQEFWFNLKTQTVEVGPQSLSIDRIGPFASYDEASRGEQIVAERARRIREELDQEDNWD